MSNRKPEPTDIELEPAPLQLLDARLNDLTRRLERLDSRLDCVAKQLGSLDNFTQALDEAVLEQIRELQHDIRLAHRNHDEHCRNTEATDD